MFSELGTPKSLKGYDIVVTLQARCGPEGSRSFRLIDFHDIRCMKMVKSSALRTGLCYKGNFISEIVICGNCLEVCGV